MVFDKIKKGISGVLGSGQDNQPDYIEIDLGREVKKAKVLVRTFILKSFEDINPILNSLREGYTIAIIDINPLKSRDIIELKRAISKIRKTVEALDGSINGFGENIIIATPEFAEIYKSKSKSPTHSEDNILRK